MRERIPTPVLASGYAVWATLAARSSAAKLAAHVAARKSSSSFAEWDLKVLSQHGEDGIIAVLLEKLGITKGAFVEFGFGPTENNMLASVLTSGTSGLYIDGSAKNCRDSRAMFDLLGRKDVKFVDAWIDRDNIDRLIVENTMGWQVEILSTDLDGVDYWVLEAITSIRPSLLICEYNASFGPSRSVTVPYDRAYDRMKQASPLMHGMSLTAATKLAGSKGYGLIGCNADGGNAFFVRNDRLDGFRVQTPGEAFRPLKTRLERLSQAEQEGVALSGPLVEI